MAKDEKPPRTTEVLLKGQQRRMVEKRETPKWPRNEEDKLLVSIVDSIPACHAGDRGSIPRRGESACLFIFLRPWAESRKGQLHWPAAALLHWPGIEPRPPAWQARILLMGQQRRMVEKRETPKWPRLSHLIYEPKFFLQLTVVHWNPLCWGILLVLEWGFYLAQVESYSRLKNGYM